MLLLASSEWQLLWSGACRIATTPLWCCLCARHDLDRLRRSSNDHEAKMERDNIDRSDHRQRQKPWPHIAKAWFFLRSGTLNRDSHRIHTFWKLGTAPNEPLFAVVPPLNDVSSHVKGSPALYYTLVRIKHSLAPLLLSILSFFLYQQTLDPLTGTNL